jgi:translation initiation factor IF-3
LKGKVRINEYITARELRVIDDEEGNLGVIPLSVALEKARAKGLDLIEISPEASPPVAKIMDYGKYKYLEEKKLRQTKGRSRGTETKSIQVKIGTGDHDLIMKAERASRFLGEGHRVKVELFLPGRAKYLDKGFLSERLERFLKYLAEDYKIADPAKKSPKGLSLIIEREKTPDHKTTSKTPPNQPI